MKRLYRSNKDIIVGGLCAGLGEYLDIDPTIVRLLTVGLALVGGLTIWCYIIGWIIVPQNPNF